MTEGWILLHRKLQECEIWANSQPFDMRSAWVDLLLLANHRDANVVFDYEPMIVKRGQYLTSVRKLSARWSWSKDRTLKYLRLLESLKMIHRESNNQRTLITIENYGVYQDAQDTDADTTSNTKRTRNGRKADTTSPQTNNDNNDNNENKKHIYGEFQNVRLTDSERDKLFNDYGEEETKDAIRYLDERIEMKGYKYKSHYLALRKWVFDAIADEKKNGKFKKGETSDGLGNKVEPDEDEFRRNQEYLQSDEFKRRSQEVLFV